MDTIEVGRAVALHGLAGLNFLSMGVDTNSYGAWTPFEVPVVHGHLVQLLLNAAVPFRMHALSHFMHSL